MDVFGIADAEVLAETDRAILVQSPELEENIWVPKSVIHDDSEVYEKSIEGGGPALLIVKFWFAEKEGWV